MIDLTRDVAAARRASGTPAANSRRLPSSPATMPSPSVLI
jgi:hypothetical protein